VGNPAGSNFLRSSVDPGGDGKAPLGKTPQSRCGGGSCEMEKTAELIRHHHPHPCRIDIRKDLEPLRLNLPPRSVSASPTSRRRSRF